MDNERIKNGRDRLNELSPGTPDGLDGLFGEIAPDFLNNIYEYSFGTLYSGRDDKLDPKARQAATLAVLVTQNQQRLIATHIGIARNLGFTYEELAELFTQIGAYAGFAPAVTAMTILKEDYDRTHAAQE